MRFRPAKKDAPPPRERSFSTRPDCDYRHVESQCKNRGEREQYYSFSSDTYNNNTSCQSGGGASEAKSVSGNFFNCPGGTN